VSVVAITAGIPAALTGVQASVTHHPPAVSNPYSPAYHHAYRHGVTPTLAQQQKMNQWAATHPRPKVSANDLNYGGGIDGIGVTTGHQKVYLVFYGSQWGTQGTNSNGDTTLSGDPSGMAPYLQELMKGLGTNNELWSGVMTQYCDGVATGSQSCPASNTQHVGYPSGGALAGVWVDESTASPQQSTGHQLGVEAVSAAAHFGNTTAASNRSAQYVVISPHGTNPDGWLTNGFCAWHDYNGDSTLSGGPVTSPYGDIAFTNLPYITDQGSSCGQGFVNSPGTLDGVSIVEGHEYAETVTDQNPAGGWTDSSGAENGDKCAWIAPGSAGGGFNLTLATGSFAMQTTWANDGSGGAGTCEASHAIVGGGGGGNTVTVTNPGSQTTTVGTPVSLQIHATDSASGQTLTYSATGLPAGLSINSSTGLISGTPSTVQTTSVTVKATDTTGANGSASFSWTISSAGGGGGIVNGGFETGTFSGWTTSGAATSIVNSGAHSGTYAAQAGSTSPTNGDSNIAQTFTVPSGNGTLAFWYNVTCPDTVTYDWATATLKNNTTGTTTTPLAKTCVSSSGWKQVTASVIAGDSYTLTLTSHDDNYSGDPTRTLFDDASLSAATANPVVNGGFEAGTFSGWTTSGAATSIVNSGAHSGTYAARAGSTSPTNGDSNIVQTFTAASGNSTLTFYYNVTCPDTVTYDWATATLKNNTTGTTATVLAKSCVSSSGWKPVTASIIGGDSYTLTLTSHDDNYSGDPTYTLFDDVSAS
jgi:serine protease